MFYGLSCLIRQSSALWKHNKHSGSTLEHRDLEHFPTIAPPQRDQISTVFGLYGV